MKKYYSVLFVYLFLAACAGIKSDKLEQSEIYTSYDATYTEGNDFFLMYAKFTAGKGLGATQVSLVSPSEVKVDGETLSEDRGLLGEVGYSRKLKASNPDELNQSHVIKYTDNKKIVYENSFQIPSKIEFESKEKFKKSEGFAIDWKSETEMSDGDRLEVSISFPNTAVLILSSRENTKVGTIHVGPQEYADAKSGWGKIKLCRVHQWQDVKAPSVGGSLITEYCTRTKSIRLED